MTTSSSLLPGGTWTWGDRTVSRFGYGAMQLAGPGVLGPPPDPKGALAVLREVVSLGITHIDTSDAYGPGVTNQLIRSALHPYGKELHIATNVGAVRDPQGGWPVARRPADVRAQVHDNLRGLGLDRLDLVYLRMGDAHGPRAESLEESFSALVELQQQGLIRRVGVSNVTSDQVAEAQRIAPIACVQNMYNVAHRQDDSLIDSLAAAGVAYVPFFPLGGFSPLQSGTLSRIAQRVGGTPMSVALAWLLQRSPNILLIPGTSRVAHLRANVAGAALVLTEDERVELDLVGA